MYHPALMGNPTEITLHAPAKVNFHLTVLGKRPDGYHELVMLMQALEFGDTVVLKRAEAGVEVTSDSPDVPLGADNIVHKAVTALLTGAGAGGGVKAHIIKRTPMAAGLGGGSSDAAAALRGTNILYGLGLSDARLREVGVRLGADVPFFLSWPSALAEGIGDILTEAPAPSGVWVTLVNPGFPVPTGWVYSNLNLGLTNTADSIKLPHLQGLASGEGYGPMRVASVLKNDLEPVTIGRHPEIGDIKARLIELGAAGALMSGSGPTVFGVFDDGEKAAAAARALARPGWFTTATKTLSRWQDPVVIY